MKYKKVYRTHENIITKERRHVMNYI